MSAKTTPPVGSLFYDGIDYIFQQTENGPTMFAEIRGNGADLPMDANAEKLCLLWNKDLCNPEPKSWLPELPNERYWFDDADVMAEVADTEYARGKVQHALMNMTSNEKYALYRAVVKLARKQSEAAAVAVPPNRFSNSTNAESAATATMIP